MRLRPLNLLLALLAFAGFTSGQEPDHVNSHGGGIDTAAEREAFRAALGAASSEILSAHPAPSNVLIYSDEFRTTDTEFTAGATRVATPGPATMTAVQSSAAARKPLSISNGELTMVHNTSTAATYAKWDGVTAAAGLTAIFDVSITPLLATGRLMMGFSSDGVSGGTLRGAITTQGSEATNATSGVLIQTGANTSEVNTIQTVIYSGFPTGTKVRLAVRYDSTTLRSYWMQGGSADALGCVIGSARWMHLGWDSGAEFTGTVYPFVDYYGGGIGIVSRVEVYSQWTPPVENPALDFQFGKILHVPSVATDPATGLVVATWNKGNTLTHVSDSIAVTGGVRKADGTWNTPQTLVPAPGGGAGVHNCHLTTYGGQLYLVYWLVNVVADGGSLLKAPLTVNPTTGAITVGTPVAHGISGTNNLAFNPPIHIAHGAYAGRIVQLYHRSDAKSYCAYSDDQGATWTEVAITPSLPAGTSGMYEPTGVVEGDGAIGAYFRSTAGYLYYSRSTDGGETWPLPAPNRSLPNPGSRTYAATLSNGESWLIGNETHSGRTAVTMTRIGDEGEIGEQVRIMDSEKEDGTAEHYQYPTFVETVNGVGFLFACSEASGTSCRIQFSHRAWLDPLSADVGGLSNRSIALRVPPSLRRDRSRAMNGSTYLRGRLVELTQPATYAASYTPAVNAASRFRMVLTGNLTLNNPTGMVPDQEVTWQFVQDSTGNRTITLGSAFSVGPHTVTLSTAANAVDYLTARYDNNRGKWDVVSFLKGY